MKITVRTEKNSNYIPEVRAAFYVSGTIEVHTKKGNTIQYEPHKTKSIVLEKGDYAIIPTDIYVREKDDDEIIFVYPAFGLVAKHGIEVKPIVDNSKGLLHVIVNNRGNRAYTIKNNSVVGKLVALKAEKLDIDSFEKYKKEKQGE